MEGGDAGNFWEDEGAVERGEMRSISKGVGGWIERERDEASTRTRAATNYKF